MLPNFICPGAQRCGTTTLYFVLSSHPDIFLSPFKETGFFLEEEKLRRGLDFYLKQYFRDWKGEKIVGEVDPDYMYFEEVAGRIKSLLGDGVHLLFLLRNPVDRAFSHYLLTKSRGLEPLSFEQAIEAEGERLKKGYFERIHYSYIDRGFYSRQIKPYLELFPRENLLFVIFEEMVERPAEILRKIFSFLEVDPSPANELRELLAARSYPSGPAFIQRLIFRDSPAKKLFKLLPFSLRKRISEGLFWKLHQGKASPKTELSSETRRRLEELYSDEIDELEKLLGRDLSLWRKDG